MSEYIYINSIDSTPEWEQILKTVIEYCNEFDIVFPNGEYDADNPLLAGMLDFKKIPNICVSPWPNMKDSFKVSVSFSNSAHGNKVSRRRPKYHLRPNISIKKPTIL